MADPKTILITGVSSGLGHALADAALRRGDLVVGTVRSPEAARRFQRESHGSALVRLLDLSSADAVSSAMASILRDVGSIDALVANAGYGHEGLLEESSLDDARRQFEVNVFSTVEVIVSVLPLMRRQRRGRIIGITSVGGLTTSPGLSLYHGSKFAMEGILEALGREVEQLGIRVTAVEPGPFRTDWSGRSMQHSVRRISDYDASYEPIRAARAAANGHQPGDPTRAADALLALIDAPEPPRHLVLGSAALDAIAASRKAFDDEQASWAQFARSTDFPQDEHGSVDAD